ncbi:MAG: hybrid sensor histidine kinase/response regulator [Pseudobacteriovorax sp.]|nr:hybrid sensor histidine kinase/response regulator [Pseudobacteriovorax sp.]
MSDLKFTNSRVLIVDDEPKNLKIMKIRLEDDFELLSAHSGEEALELIEDFDPALVLLDIMMPGISGYDVVKQVKSNPKLESCKIILVSGKALIEEKMHGYSVGVEDYITKPFNGKELLAKVNVFVKMYNLEKDLHALNKSLENEVEQRSAQLVKSERMAFVGMNAAEIVHNLKGPLSVIKGYIFHLEKKLPESPELAKISAATDKILDITKNILTSISQDIKSEMEDICINDVIKDEINFMKGLDADLRYEIDLEFDLQATRLVVAQRSHLAQVFGNLIKNAIEAMETTETKSLSIATKDTKSGVNIRFADSGEGVSEELREKVFEPLFTTKSNRANGDVGNGLGLPFCRRMIETYGGNLNLEQNPKGGVIASIDLPARFSQLDGDLKDVS